MIFYELCFGSDKNNIFCLEISYKYFTKVCNKYKLKEKGIFKEYTIDNKTIIKSHRDIVVFTNKYLETEFIKGHLFIKKEVFIEENIEQFSDSDNESEYILYESILNDIHIICKKYPIYFTLSIGSEKKENIINLLETLKNIYY